MDGCKLVIANIYEYVDGELRGEKHIKIVRHLQTCKSCSNKVHFQASFKLMIKKNTHQAMPGSVKSMIIDSITKESKKKSNEKHEVLSAHITLQEKQESQIESDDGENSDQIDVF